MSLAEQINADLITAMKAKEAGVVSALRLITAELKNERIAKGSDMTDADVIAVLKREAKKRKETLEIYQQQQRPELAATEQVELDVINRYVPQVDEAAVAAAVQSVLAANPGATIKDMGKLMAAAMAALGPGADGGAVSALIKSALHGPTP